MIFDGGGLNTFYKNNLKFNRMVQEIRVTIDPEICSGKPTITGTRIMISIILEFIEEGYQFKEIIENYPSLTIEDIKAAVRYARMLIEGDENVYFEGNEISA